MRLEIEPAGRTETVDGRIVRSDPPRRRDEFAATFVNLDPAVAERIRDVVNSHASLTGRDPACMIITLVHDHRGGFQAILPALIMHARADHARAG